LSDLQYKLVKLPWKKKLLRFFLWFSVSAVIAVIYIAVFGNIIVSPEEKVLSQQVENIKLQYSLLNRELDNSIASLSSFRLSDDRRYRPILEMDSIPESFRKAGYGGVDRFRDVTGYINSDIFISARIKVEEIKNLANVQNESFKTIAERSAEWKEEMDHLPMISPVDVKYRLGDKFGFRKNHPVLGISRNHPGLDIPVPRGTEVYATGDGKIIESGWSSGGFGNLVVIDHGYGLQTTYGHLSKIKVVMGMNVKRGELIGLSGSTGISTGPHLHYQIEKFGKHVNPVNFFNNDISAEEYNEMIQTLESESKFR
jgi:murein DD-endopeptidase MepM/ murein hydrolase activator NlpD